ncbi:unnamed protein product [Chironomus riparius]|uniref:Uncharacterized protein n=1 Tax=Chironomus riparius TaxID=315576 RepID=A0A9N9WXK6_9DIPT|nr:unnamed protein product [Chironomus riparius]
MFKLFVLAVALTCISAAPQGQSTDGQAQTLSNTSSDDGVGNFAYAFETSNSIKAEAKGSLKQLKDDQGKETAGEVQQGSYSWTDASGTTYEVKWIADENGFQPQGAHLPTTPKAP